MDEDESDERYVDEFGQPLPRWKPIEPEVRHRHATFEAAAKAALDSLMVSRHPFMDAVADSWPEMFPNLPARPGHFEDGKMFLYVPNAPVLFSLRPKLAEIRRRLMALPNVPKNFDVKLEIRKKMENRK